jgi:hypothetical protein
MGKLASGKHQNNVYTLAKMAREIAGGDDGKKLLQVLMDIALDNKAKNRDRIVASVEILNRGFGKPLDPESLAKGEQPQSIIKAVDLTKLSKEELKEYWRILRIIAGDAPNTNAGDNRRVIEGRVVTPQAPAAPPAVEAAATEEAPCSPAPNELDDYPDEYEE